MEVCGDGGGVVCGVCGGRLINNKWVKVKIGMTGGGGVAVLVHHPRFLIRFSGSTKWNIASLRIITQFVQTTSCRISSASSC